MDDMAQSAAAACANLAGRTLPRLRSCRSPLARTRRWNPTWESRAHTLLARSEGRIAVQPSSHGTSLECHGFWNPVPQWRGQCSGRGGACGAGRGWVGGRGRRRAPVVSRHAACTGSLARLHARSGQLRYAKAAPSTDSDEPRTACTARRDGTDSGASQGARASLWRSAFFSGGPSSTNFGRIRRIGLCCRFRASIGQIRREVTELAPELSDAAENMVRVYGSVYDHVSAFAHVREYAHVHLHACIFA